MPQTRLRHFLLLLFTVALMLPVLALLGAWWPAGAAGAQALDILRHQVGATAAIFLGDDVTDEKAFARLSGPDLGIRVGAGESLAAHYVNDPADVATVLAFLLEERRAWLHGDQAVPIERLTMLANERSVALVTPDAKVNWLCHPEPDSAAIFADLLGGPAAGHFSIKPEHGSLPLGQRYLPGTMIVETRWSRLLVTDYLEHDLASHRTDLVRRISGSSAAICRGVKVRLTSARYRLWSGGSM